MKDKRKDGEGGGRPRGSRKNIIGSESQALLQAAAGSGFIGFSAFHTPATPAFAGAPGVAGGGTSPPSVKASGGTGSRGQRRVKTAKVDGGRSSGSAGQVLPPHYSGGNSHLAVVSKRLSKRDVITKLKALAELRSMCRLVTDDGQAAAATAAAPTADSSATSAEDLGGLAPHWIFLYQRLSAEGDRRTREAANATLLCMLRANRRAFQPLMRSLMGAWWCSQADTAAEVSASAKEAFDAIFPEAKRASVLRRCAGGVLSHINTAVHQTPEMLEESSGCTAEEAEKRAERLTVSALSALSNLLGAVGDEANSDLCAPSADGATGFDDDAAQSHQAAYPSVVNENLWARLDDPRPAVRRAAYALVSACCRHAPGLLRHPAPAGDPVVDAVKVRAEAASSGGDGAGARGAERGRGPGVGRKRSRVATPQLLVGLLSEKEELNHREAWQAALLVLREFRETWAAEKGAAAVLPTLLTRLRKGAFLATSGTSYPCLLPLLASFPLQTLLAPADGRAGAPPFCATLLETLWTTISNPGGGDGGGGGLDAPGGERGGSSGWLGDVASAHVECATFLLLKLPPPPTPGGNAADDAVSGDYATAAVAPAGVPPPAAGGVGEEDPASVAVGVSAAVDNVIRVVKSLAVDGGEEDAAAGTGEGLGGGRVQRTARQSPIVREAFSRALGQLHLGAEKGTGVMGSATESAALWGAVLRELKGALDQRSWDGTRWMGNVLARALATVNGRQGGDDAVQSTPAGPKSIQGAQDGGGLRGVCRALFLHCAVSIGYVEGAAEGEGLAAISPRDSPLVAFMSTVVDALGVDGVFRMREPTRPGDSGPAGGAGGGDTIGGALSRDAATEFYDKFLVPRLVASSSSSSATSAVDGVEALKTVAERFLVAEDASRQTDGFRLLLGKALAEDGRGWMRTATMVLRLAPPGMARDFPEINAAVLRACGVSAPGAEPPSPPRPTEARPGRPAAQDLPALLQASLGVREGRAVAGPFIKPSTVSEVVKVAISPADLSSAALEGLLGVLAAGGSAAADAAACGNAGADDDGAPEDDALATVRKEGLSLLLAAFSGFGGRGGTGADRLWRDCGAPVLEALVVAGGDEGSTSASASPRTATEDPLRRRGVLQDFLGGAVERTRSAMEDGGSGDGAERAATLAWALIDLQRTLRRRWRRGEGGAAALPQDLPVLWRLGLTCPSVWRERRLEALAGSAGAAGATAAATAATAADLARACVGSRWARRWECVSLILARLPDERARLSVLAEGVVHADEAAGDGAALGVAGEALHEILAAGVVVSRAERLLEGKGYGGIGTGDRLSVDLPPRLLSSPAASMGGGRGGFEPVEEFGLGLPRFLGFSPPTAVAAEQPGAVAAVAAAGVLDAMAVHLGKTKTSGFKTPSPAPAKAAEAESSPIADSQRQHRQQHPFSLLLPQGLWRAAFRPPSPSPSPSPSPAAPEDLRLHGVLLSAFLSAVKGMAEDAAAAVAAGGCVGGAGEAGAWRVSCSAEISTGLVVALVGETFTRGLGLGDNANRLMATRCGVFKAPTPSAADLLPGARTLYTSDGQAVTVVAAHVDPGGGEGYYTVRPIPEPGAVAAADPGRERQTILERLSVLPPPSASPRRTREGTATGVSAACPWLVRPSVAGKLGALVAGPFLAIEQGLWEKLGRSSAGSGPEGPALVSAAAAALRGLASTCVRAALLCGDGDGVEDVKEEPEEASAAGGDQVWEGVRSRVLALRNRWASAAVKSGSAAVAARVGGGSSPLEATATLALSTAVLSGFLAATPLLPSDEEGMRLMPVRVRGALLAEAEAGAADAAGAAGAAASSAAADAALGWARAQRAASLAWLRDCAEASTMVHVSPSAGSLDSQIFLDTQAEAEAAVVALASAGRAASAVGGGGSVDDLALARACGGLFAGESYRLSRGHPTTLSCESKAAVVSWAVSKFLLSGGRMASSSSAPPGRRAESGGVHDDISLCLETARLLTAIAWDGREGWGGAGGAASASAAAAGLVGARVDDRSRVWEAARAPAVWRGLHAAVVGAVGSPVLQLCAFEVLEAAAADWPCAVAAPSPEGGGDDGAEDGKGAGGTGAGSGGEGEDGGGATAPEAGGQSIVSRLAKALGGWGLASAQEAGAAGGDGGGGDADRKGAGGGGQGADLAGSEAVKEEAKEQQDDLELIARCFPEDLLLAVEALPSTIDALSEIPEASRGTDGDSYEIDEEDEDEDEEEGEEEVEVDYGPTAQGEGGDEDGSADDPASPENGSQVAPSADSDASEQGLEPRPDDDGGLVAPPLPPHGTGGGSKSRRKRLRRRRISGNSSSTSNYGSAAGAAARGRGRRSPAAGPSLTAPFLTWLLWLEHCRRAAKQEAKAKPAARAFVVRAGALAPVLEACFRVLRFSQGVGGRGAGAAARLGPAQAVRVSRLDPRDPHDLARLALAVYFRTVHVFPALSRSWWADDCARGQRVWVADFTKRHVSPALIQIEAQVISEATDKGLWGQDGGEMSVRSSSNSRQVVASYLKEECTLEAVIQLPPEYPLRNVEVTCSQRMGVSESRWRQWVLQIVTLLSLQDGSVLDAVMMWKKNVDKEFEGVEPCVICYSVLHPKTMDLPQMTCKTCSNKFHSSCLYKWFHTSHKNKCPICQQTWA